NQIGASVVTFDAGNYDHTVTINRGTEHGIIPDMGVVAPEGLVGVVTKSWNGGSQGQLVNDPGFGAAVQDNGVFGTAVTQDGGHAERRHVEGRVLGQHARVRAHTTEGRRRRGDVRL